MDDVEKLKEFFLKVLDSKGIPKNEMEILENNLDFAISVSVTNTSLKKIINILTAFRQIEIILGKKYLSEIDLYEPYLELFLDKKKEK